MFRVKSIMARGKPTDPKVQEIIIYRSHKRKTMREICSELTIATATSFNITKEHGEIGSVDVRAKSAVSEGSLRYLITISRSRRRNTLRKVTAGWNRETGMNVFRECCCKHIHKSDRYSKV